MSHPARGAWIEIHTEPWYQSPIDGRTPQGVRGLKYSWTGFAYLQQSRTPQGVRGLK